MDTRIISSCQYFKEFDEYYGSDYSGASCMWCDIALLFGKNLGVVECR